MSSMKVTMRSTVAARPARNSTVVARASAESRRAGFDLIYEARELDLPQNVRDGMTQARADVASTKKRISESEARIDSKLEPSIQKAYWTEAREELRRQVGTLRFDLDTIVLTKPGKDEKKRVAGLRKEFIAQVEALDYALVKKNQSAALEKLASTKAALDSVIAAL